MTTKQRKIFMEIVDLNHEKVQVEKKLEAKKEELKKAMGANEYYKFMSMGQKMFAPAEE